MKKYIFLSAILILFAAAIPCLSETQQVGSYKIIDNFNSYKIGKFPSSWRTWPFQRGKASEIYHVEEENGLKFIHGFDDKNYSIQALNKFFWQIDKYPYLSWKWRARILPEGAREDDGSKNDSACGVYVIIGQWDGQTIKYVWSTSLPIGTEVSRRNGKLKVSVLETSSKNLNNWKQKSINVTADYEKLFGKKLDKNPTGIAILTDGNAVHKPSSCDYTDFIISKEPIGKSEKPTTSGK